MGRKRASPTGRASTREGVELTLIWIFVLVRTIDLVQAIAGCLSIGSAIRPWWYVTFLAAALIESVVVGLLLVRRRSVQRSQHLVGVDVAFAVLLLSTMPIYVATPDRVGSWLAWSFPFTLSTAGLIGICEAGRVWRPLVASLAPAGVYVGVVAVPLLSRSSEEAASGLANACAYPAFGLVLWTFARFVRRIADEADEARRRVAELEQGRSRAVVHDMLGYLRLDRLLEARPEVQTMLVEQALTKYRQMRAYVDGTDQPGDVEACLRSVVELYPSVDTRLVVHLEEPVVLQDEVALALHQAVETAFSNVQANAPDAGVVITADTDGDRVVVTLVDDGPGFDIAATTPGFGIAETLGRQLEVVGGAGRVASRPGAGTQIEITVPRRLSVLGDRSVPRVST